MLSRRMLSKDDENANGGADVEVSREDQDKINRFSRLHQREKTIEDELKTKTAANILFVRDPELTSCARQKDKEDLEEISTELELADEDELVPYKIGDTFFNLPVPKVQSLLTSSTSSIETQVESLEEQLHEVKEEMQGLKGKLYARFGRNINLET
ncbi:MAG: hypothetical protein Q9160_004661 [Pyrenula sp. 1 TL-2023]